MSTKNVTINGQSYTGVPAVDIPITGTTNKARFVEISDTTAVASDVATGKTFYLADGTKTTGTASAGSVVITDTTDSHGGTIRNISTTDAILLSPTLNITSNGTYTGETSPYKEVWHEINVSVSGGGSNVQANKNVTPTVSGLTVNPDTGYDAMAKVTIAGITTMTLPTSATNIATGTNKATIGRSTSNQFINIPTGYNTAAAYYTISAVANGSATTPTKTITANPSITVTNGNISASVSGSSSITPTVSAGYVSAGTAGTVSVSGSSSVAATSLDSNLVAGNIKNGTTIFGVTGTYTGGGGATNFVTGTFTVGNTGGKVESVTIPYTGSGYLQALTVVVEGGAYVSGTTWYNSLTRYAVGQWTFTKSNMSTTPTYATSGAANQGVTAWIYKNSTTSGTSYSRSSAMTTVVLNSSSTNASGTGANCVKFKGSSKAMTYYTANNSSSTYGLLPGITYRYYAIYSS